MPIIFNILRVLPLRDFCPSIPRTFTYYIPNTNFEYDFRVMSIKRIGYAKRGSVKNHNISSLYTRVESLQSLTNYRK